MPALLPWLSARSLMVALTTIAQCGTSDAGRPPWILWFSASFCQQQWHQSLGSQAKPMKPYWSNMRDSCILPYANPILGINVELLNLKTTIGLPLARHYQKAPLSRSRSKLSPPITCFSPWMAGLGDRIAHSAPILEDLFWMG